MNAQPSVSKELVAQDFKSSLQGKLEGPQLDAAANAILSSQTKYSANGSVASAIFYLRFQVSIKGGKTFNGNAGGISSPGGGALFGDVYTDDVNALYANTHSFAFQSTPVYLSIQFFDKHSKLLGHFQSGAVSTVAGTGGGTGGWS
jgi:hypothetical protein